MSLEQKLDIILNEAMRKHISFNTSHWEWENGKKPVGRGVWFFEIRSTKGDKKKEYSPKGSLTYGEAKKEVIKYVRDNYPKDAYVEITVLT